MYRFSLTLFPAGITYSLFCISGFLCFYSLLCSCLSFLLFFSFSCCILFFFFFSSRRRHTRCLSDWSSDVCSSDLYRNPSWGGWGGRYVYRRPYGETRPIWTQGGDLFGRVTSQDTVIGVDGKTYVSDQATIWRWRTAFQHDFAARMDWTVKPYADANHNPSVIVNGKDGSAPVIIETQVGAPVTLDASLSRDPDGQSLIYQWFHYAEAGFVPGQNMAAVTISQGDKDRAVVTATAACRPNWIPANRPCPSGVAHIILAVTDSGSPSLTSYRRVILNVSAARNSAQ